MAASNPPLITLESRESRLQIRGNPKLEFARKSPPKPQFTANPIAEIPAISIANQSLRNISRSTMYYRLRQIEVERLKAFNDVHNLSRSEDLDTLHKAVGRLAALERYSQRSHSKLKKHIF